MKILFLAGEFPTPALAEPLRDYNFLKILSQKYDHDISLVTLKEKTREPRYIDDLQKYCRQIETTTVPEHKGLSLKSAREFSTLKNMLSPQNVFSKNHAFLNTYYVPAMQRKVREILSKESFDIIYAHPMNMYFYILDVSLPRVIDCPDAAFNQFYELYKLERNPARKIAQWLLYYRVKRDLRCAYKAKIDLFTVVSSQERDILNSYLPGLNVAVVPQAVDIDFFKPMSIEEDFPNLIFVGSMQTDNNVAAVVYFCDYIYPVIKRQSPDIKLQIVGRHADKTLQQLTSDSSILLKGYVEDIRPYLARSSIVVVPMVSGGGMKTKVLEAMAMGKPVISTSIGATGLEIVPGKDIIIADDPREFATQVVRFLHNKPLRQEIGSNARRLVESRYSWEISADTLNGLLRSIAAQR